MVLPDAFNGDINNVHYYQGIIIAEVSVTLALYIVLRIIHYVKWGADQEAIEEKREPKADVKP